MTVHLVFGYKKTVCAGCKKYVKSGGKILFHRYKNSSRRWKELRYHAKVQCLERADRDILESICSIQWKEETMKAMIHVLQNVVFDSSESSSS